MVSRFALQALISLGIVAAALMLTDGQPSYAQGDEGCHFLMHLRKPIEFTGPAGGADFVLYQETKYKANIYLSNIYGDQPCNWQASTNQNWLDLSRTSGQIAADDDTFITVSINGRAQDLPRGVHKAEVVLKSSQGRERKYPWKVEVIVYARIPCDLRVSGGTYKARVVQGSVPGHKGFANLTNVGDAPCHWQANSDRAWLTVMPASGTVSRDRPEHITISVNAGAANLVPDDYDATITLQWRETHYESLSIEAKLEVEEPPCELYFEEGQRFEAVGKAGSHAFTPANGKFVLQNRGGSPCFYWKAHYTAQWLLIEDEGTVPGGGGTADVILQVNQEVAAELLPGTFEKHVQFGAGDKLADHGIIARLTVEPLDCHLEVAAGEGLYFRMEPAELNQGISEQLVTLTNDPKNATCHWEAVSLHDWINVEPPAGVLIGGESKVVAVKIIPDSTFDELGIGEHKASLEFSVTDGTAADMAPLTVQIECQPNKPCAYLHSSHIKTEIGKKATINLTMYNPLDQSIKARLIAEMPSGWELESESFAERCGAICTGTYEIAPNAQDFIEIYAVPNNLGDYSFEATVNWTMAKGGIGEGSEGITLRLPVEVTLPATGSATPQQPPATSTPIPTPTPEPVAVATVVPSSGEPPAGGQSGANPPADDTVVGGIPNGRLLALGIAGAIALVVAGVFIALIVRLRPAAIDYDELAQAQERVRRSR